MFEVQPSEIYDRKILQNSWMISKVKEHQIPENTSLSYGKNHRTSWVDIYPKSLPHGKR